MKVIAMLIALVAPALVCTLDDKHVHESTPHPLEILEAAKKTNAYILETLNRVTMACKSGCDSSVTFPLMCFSQKKSRKSESSVETKALDHRPTGAAVLAGNDMLSREISAKNGVTFRSRWNFTYISVKNSNRFSTDPLGKISKSDSTIATSAEAKKCFDIPKCQLCQKSLFKKSIWSVGLNGKPSKIFGGQSGAHGTSM